MQRADQELVAVRSWTTPGASAWSAAARAPRGVPHARANLAAIPGISKNPAEEIAPLTPARKTTAENFFPVTLGRGRGPVKKNPAEIKLQATGARVRCC